MSDEGHLSRLLVARAIEGRVDTVMLHDDSKFWALAQALTKKSPEGLKAEHHRYLLAIDPGETTGIAVWDPTTKLIYLCQLETKQVGPAYDKIKAIIDHLCGASVGLEHVRYEDYRVYGHMTETHAFSHLHTVRIIGAIEVACHLAQVPQSCCLAMHAKTFWADSKLKLCDVYNKGMHHSRDAQRHLLRYMTEVTA